MERKILAYLREHEDEIFEDLRLLVQAQAATSDILQLRECRQVLEQLITARTGITPTVHGAAGGHDVVSFAYGTATEQILLVGHYDTVHPVGSFEYREEGNKIAGPGVYDMKNGLVSAIWTIRAYQQLGLHPRKKIVVLFNGDEETGSEESTELIRAQALRSAAALVLEPATAEGDLKTGRKGMLEFRVTITGREAHSGNAHAEGINAIEEMAHEILYVQRLTDYDRGITANVGIAGGGTKTNVVAGKAVFEAEMRICAAAQKKEILTAMEQLRATVRGAETKVELLCSSDPMEQTEGNLQLFEKAKSCGEKLGLSFSHQFVGGFSDANGISALGIPVLDGLGAVGDCAHSPQEFIWKDAFLPRIALLAGLILDI